MRDIRHHHEGDPRRSCLPCSASLRIFRRLRSLDADKRSFVAWIRTALIDRSRSFATSSADCPAISIDFSRSTSASVHLRLLRGFSFISLLIRQFLANPEPPCQPPRGIFRHHAVPL
jgi:hypothetical protein